MRLHECGLWVPDVMTGPAAYIRRSASLADHVALLPADRRRTCVQAGGHIGVYPIALAKMFETVITFEPEPENFVCLLKNIEELERVDAFHAFLGADDKYRKLNRHSKSSGGHQTGEAVKRGGLPTRTIDSMCLLYLDAIFLDLEGFEGPALEGAVRSVAHFKPLLVFEENGKGRRYGYSSGALEDKLNTLGYRTAAKEGEDVAMVWGP